MTDSNSYKEQEQLAVLQKRVDDQLSFIDTLKRENFEYREKIRSLDTLDSKVDALLSMDRTSQDNTNGKTGQIDVNDLKSQGFLTKEDLEQEKEKARKESNFKEVYDSFIESFGKEKYLEVIQVKAKEVGLSIEEIDKMAMTSPKAVLKLLGADKKYTQSTQGSVNTQAFDKQNSSTQTIPKSVMYGATTKDMVSAWKQAGDLVKQQLEGNNNNANNY